jgi:hypothetical protein
MTNREEYDNLHEYARETVSKLRTTYARVTEILQEINQDRTTTIQHLPAQYAPGDEVWLFKPNIKPGASDKLTVKWKGPYTVLSRVTNTTYRICKNGKEQTVNEHRLQNVTSSLSDDRQTEIGKRTSMASTTDVNAVATHTQQQTHITHESQQYSEHDGKHKALELIQNAAMYLAAATDVKW